MAASRTVELYYPKYDDPLMLYIMDYKMTSLMIMMRVSLIFLQNHSGRLYFAAGKKMLNETECKICGKLLN
jgi:hypothetical protein